MENFLIRGFDQLGDVNDWGELLLPRLREGIEKLQPTERVLAHH
ncbi:MAG: hypothetical protein ACTHVY_13455 [Brevibacterium yomogidense]